MRKSKTTSVFKQHEAVTYHYANGVIRMYNVFTCCKKSIYMYIYFYIFDFVNIDSDYDDRTFDPDHVDHYPNSIMLIVL